MKKASSSERFDSRDPSSKSNDVTPETAVEAAEAVSFESSLESLEKIVKDLERGQLSLEESLSQFSEATMHLKFCYSALESAQRKVALLKEVSSSGKPTLQQLDDVRGDVSIPSSGRRTNRDSSMQADEELADEE